MATRQEAHKARTTAKSKYTRAETALNDALDANDIAVSTIERRFKDLKSRWDEVQDAHDIYLNTLEGTPEEETTPTDALETWISELAARFNKIEVQADKRIESLIESRVTPHPAASQSASRSNTSANSKVMQSAVKIERVRYPPYEGDIRQYPTFKEEFVKHIAPQCSPDQLAFVLKGYLNVEVKEEIENCGEDYNAIWERLDERYGDKGRLISQIMDEISKLPPKNDEAYSLLMIRTVEKAHRDLIRLKEEEELFNVQTITSIERRMTEPMRQEWAKELVGKHLSSKDKFRRLMDHLKGWRSRLEYLMDDVRSPILPVIRTKTHHVNQEDKKQTAPRKSDCWIHSQPGVSSNHPIWRCREFLSHTAEGRKKLVQDYKACQSCLLNTCPGRNSVDECKSGFKCTVGECSGNHNRLLHGDQVKPGTTSAVVKEADTKNSTLLQMQSI